MKQHITVEQLREFTKDKKENIEIIYELLNSSKPIDFYNNLPKWVKKDRCNTYEEWFENCMMKRLGEINYDYSVKMDIGKMIEILEKDHQVTIDGNYESNKWSVVLYKKDSKRDSVDYHSHKEELCNALWDVVKEVLI